MSAMRFVLAMAMLLLTLGSAFAVQPDEVLKDPVLERRAREISSGLRCLVCQNQSIDDSDADLARDLRLLVRERLSAGDTDRAGARFRGPALRRVRSPPPHLPRPHAGAVADPFGGVGAGGSGGLYGDAAADTGIYFGRRGGKSCRGIVEPR